MVLITSLVCFACICTILRYFRNHLPCWASLQRWYMYESQNDDKVWSDDLSDDSADDTCRVASAGVPGAGLAHGLSLSEDDVL